MNITYYFAIVDGEQKGPIPSDRLVEAGIRPSTFVWCKGMDDWKRADEVEEIRNLFRRHIEHEKEKAAFEGSRVKDTPDSRETQSNPGAYRFHIPEQHVEEDLRRPPQVSLTLAIMSLLLCFPPTGIAAVVYAYKAMKTWEGAKFEEKGESADEMRRKAHEYGRLAKMWLGLTVAFGVIFWTVVFSVKPS